MKAGVVQSSHESIRNWRCERLVESGFPLPLAARLARDPHYDVHALIELVERGCPPDLAGRILAPVDDQDAAA